MRLEVCKMLRSPSDHHGRETIDNLHVQEYSDDVNICICEWPWIEDVLFKKNLKGCASEKTSR